MTSDKETLFVWIYLPNQVSPILCGRVSRSISAAGTQLGEFVYQKAYLQEPLARPLDPVLLALKNNSYESTLLNGHFSVLLDAGPDSWGCREIDQAYGQQTDLGYLLHGAGDQVGAIAFSRDPNLAPSNAGFNGFPSATLEDLLVFAELLENDQPIPEKYHNLLKVGTSAGGARPKATLLYDDRQWLAKFPSTKDPKDLPSNPKLEKTALDLAEIAGLNVPKRQLINVAGKDVLLVERFDRHYLGDTVKGWGRRAYVSARTVFFSKPDVQRYAITGSYQRLSLELATWSRRTVDDRLELFKRIVFNCLVNNLDDHDLNHGFVDLGKGFELSPLFDVVPQRPTGVRSRLALNLGEFGGEASKENLLSECDRFGLSTFDASRIIESLRTTVKSNWEKCLIANGVSNTHIERISPAFCPEHFDFSHNEKIKH
ncbi:type II toxin-antitoxin system HipA family toxin [Undibacterium sp. RTI2.1]|uniref:type II toxin-antitoxin system HipA family toxin n=1 Tax=unclassified Undibacterium TaxID=2630295 RepID=UPI002B227D90|nr:MULTISPECIES: type II toxin-antitoxin system HipA family toxin [unclassified Undibacterium]MEB0033226.1 type II toxin-antitoxin system HipA family toxin [Undibacterium sp. RTI2.1]MEB0119018.1 type II toxin-antitoxin system HipA family toxin [Undibacterium sp. RTI2.2]